jgi:hypothetical protein
VLVECFSKACGVCEGFVGRTYDHAESSATLRIDEEQCRNRKDDLDSTVAERCVQGLIIRVTDLREDGGAVEGNDVDAAHLLRKHDGRGTVVCAPNARNGEAVAETGKVACTTGHSQLSLINDVRVVVVSGGDNGVLSKAGH